MKKFITVAVVIILLVLFFPIRSVLSDGGTVEYKAITYKISKVHKLFDTGTKDDPYIEGTIIEILGFKVYDSVR
jgi:hypothetical protein